MFLATKSYLWFWKRWNVNVAKNFFNSILCAKIQTLVEKVDTREKRQGFLFSLREVNCCSVSEFFLNGSMKNRLNAISNSFLFIKEAWPHSMLCHQKSFSHTVLLYETFLTHNRNFESASWRWYIKSFKRLQLWNPNSCKISFSNDTFHVWILTNRPFRSSLSIILRESGFKISAFYYIFLQEIR